MAARRPGGRAVALVLVLALLGLPACGATGVTDAPETPVDSLAPVASAVPTAPAAPSAPASPTVVVRGPAATFQVAYDDAVPQGARDAFAAALAIWSARLVSPVPIQVKVTWTRGGRCRRSCTLASAGPTTEVQDFPNAPLRDTLYPIALANKLAGAKLNGGAGDDPIDIEADFNSQANWFYGTGTPPNNRTSFLATAVHELAHGLGFSGSLAYERGVGSFETPPNVFDRFVANGTGQRLIAAFPNGSAALGGQLVGGDLFFDGANARAAAGGTAPRLYAPATWEEGSSLSHLDQETYISSPDAMMTPNDEGGGTVTPGPITTAIFADLGWTITAARASGAPGRRLLPRPGPVAVAYTTTRSRRSFRAVRISLKGAVRVTRVWGKGGVATSRRANPLVAPV